MVRSRRGRSRSPRRRRSTSRRGRKLNSAACTKYNQRKLARIKSSKPNLWKRTAWRSKVVGRVRRTSNRTPSSPCFKGRRGRSRSPVRRRGRSRAASTSCKRWNDERIEALEDMTPASQWRNTKKRSALIRRVKTATSNDPMSPCYKKHGGCSGGVCSRPCSPSRSESRSRSRSRSRSGSRCRSSRRCGGRKRCAPKRCRSRGRGNTSWMKHVQCVRKENPKLSLKEALICASKSYKRC
jgi:hypothetical protein